MPDSLKVLVLILPVILAGIVHSAAIRFDWLPLLAKRLDFGMCLGGRPLLGANKTFRGPIIMIVVSAAAAWVLSFGLSAAWLPQGFGFMSQPERAVWLGAVMGLGYALGELPNSFVKRRLGIMPGGSPGGIAGGICYVVDQVDSVLGVVVLLWACYTPPAGVLLTLLAAGSVVHVVFDQCLYVIGVKRRVTRTETAPPPGDCPHPLVETTGCPRRTPAEGEVVSSPLGRIRLARTSASQSKSSSVPELRS